MILVYPEPMASPQPPSPHYHGQQPHGQAYGPPSPFMPPRRPGVRGKVIAAVVVVCAALIAATAAGAFLVWQHVGSGSEPSTAFVIRLCSAQSPNPACRQQDYTDAEAAAIQEILVESAVTKYVSFDKVVPGTASGSSESWTAAGFLLHTVKPEKIETIKALVEGQPGLDDVVPG